MALELRQLTYFVAVAEELHFERAARRLSMTQPPLSQSIKQLEEELGVELFERSHRRIRLTRAGEAFLEESRRVLQAANHAVERARRVDRGEWGRLTVGFVGSATYDLLPRVIRIFRQEYPDVTVETLELSTPMQIEALRHKRIDLGVLRPPVDDPAVETETVYSTASVLAMPKAQDMKISGPLHWKDLRAMPFVLLSPKTWEWYYYQILAYAREAGFEPNILQEAMEFQTVIGLVAAGMGVAVVPKSAQNLHTEDVVYKTLIGGHPQADMAVGWRRGDQSSALTAFVEVARRIGQDLFACQQPIDAETFG
ncbi:LysR family transcriptional regulator [Sulfobacillus sp. hq2]|nr:LysR family transcriptional regulator [Sulfobacillus sp. hq2]